MTGDYFYLSGNTIHGGYYTAGKYYHHEYNAYSSIDLIIIALVLSRAGLT